MFYCDNCANKYEYPETLSKSYGSCEVCREQAICNDRPSRLLPMPKPQPVVESEVVIWLKGA